MFVTKNRLKERIGEIYKSIKFNRDDAIENAKIEIQIKEIAPILKRLNNLESRIGELEKQIESEQRKATFEKMYK